jgi:hypothetical protein
MRLEPGSKTVRVLRTNNKVECRPVVIAVYQEVLQRIELDVINCSPTHMGNAPTWIFIPGAVSVPNAKVAHSSLGASVLVEVTEHINAAEWE